MCRLAVGCNIAFNVFLPNVYELDMLHPQDFGFQHFDVVPSTFRGACSFYCATAGCERFLAKLLHLLALPITGNLTAPICNLIKGGHLLGVECFSAARQALPKVRGRLTALSGTGLVLLPAL
jgi:hypothetical protein